MAGVSFEVSKTEWSRALSEHQQRAAHQYPLWAQAGEIAYNSVIGNFDADGRPTKWKPLAMQTLLSYHKGSAYTKKNKEGKNRERASFKKLLEGHRILRGPSSNLIRSITKRALSDHAEVGTNKEYAAIHHFGGKTKAHTIKPKGGKYLYWPLAGGGMGVAKEVNHPGSTIPARPYLLVTDADEVKIKEKIETYLTEPFKP